MVKKLAIALVTLAGLLAVVAAGATLLFDGNRVRPMLESELSAVIGRRVIVGHVRLALLRGGMAVEDVSIADDPAFGATPFVTAKSVAVGVALVPLILSRSVHVESLTLDAPRVRLLRKPSGTWNFANLSRASSSTPGTAGTPPGSSESAGPSNLTVSRLRIVHGEIVVAETGDGAKSRTYRDVAVEARDLSFSSRFPFQLSATTPGDGAFALKGEAGPLSAGAIDETPLHADVELKHFDVAASGFVAPGAGVGGVVEFSGTLDSDGRRSTSKGRLRADRVQLVQGGTAARVPIEVEYQTAYDLKSQDGTLTRGDVHVGQAVARLAGTYSVGGATPAVRMTLGGHGLPVEQLEAALPAIGVMLPSGTSLRGGTLDTDLSIDGPIDRFSIAGPVRAADTTLRSFDLGGRLSGIAALAGVPRSADTPIQTFSMALRIGPGGIQMNDVQLVVPTIGSLNGSGTIAPTRALKFAMVAHPRTGGVLGTVARVAALGHPENGVPFRIEGTTDDPVFVPDVAAAAQNVLKSPQAQKEAAGLLRKLLKK